MDTKRLLGRIGLVLFVICITVLVIGGFGTLILQMVGISIPSPDPDLGMSVIVGWLVIVLISALMYLFGSSVGTESTEDTDDVTVHKDGGYDFH